MFCLWIFILALQRFFFFPPKSWLKKSLSSSRSVAGITFHLYSIKSIPTWGRGWHFWPRPSWRSCRCGTDALSIRFTLNQPQLLQPAEEPRTEAWSLPIKHRCAKPLEYPCAGEARTDHPGGLSLSDRQKGKSRGESMAVEEEGLRIFQSVKIKIGKKENTPPPTLSSLSASTHICVLTGRAGRQAVRAGDSRATRLLTAVV